MALFRGACERLSRLETEEGLIPGYSYRPALGEARPLEEAAYRRLMELLSGVGESERALLAYEGFKNTLNGSLGWSPLPRCRSWQPACVGGRAEGLWVRALYTRQLLVRFLSLRYRWLAARRSLGARLRVPRRPRRANARGGRPGRGGDRQVALSEEFLLWLKPGELTSSNVKPRREQACLMGRS